ncbi:MAG: MBL fold metallo-hydrolase [Gemmatimonadota bacterium]
MSVHDPMSDAVGTPYVTTTRRDFLRSSSRALALGMVAPALLQGAVPGRGSVWSPTREGFEPIRRKVGLFTGSGGTMGWLVNPSGVLVVDSQYEESAATFVSGLTERTTRRVDALVNTHHHADHVGGNAVMRHVSQTIVAHRRARELHETTAGAAGNLDPSALADETFGTEWTIRLGDETVRAKHYGPAHTGGDCTVFFQEADVVHMGDLLFNRVYPFIDRPGGASIQGWVQLLESVSAEHGARTVYIAGHAHPDFGVVAYRDDLLVMRDYLSALLDRAQEGIQAGSSVEEITSVESLPDFPNHRSLSPRLSLSANLQVAWEELTAGR